MLHLLIPLLGPLPPQGHTEAFLEVTTPDPTYFVHERIPVRLRFGFERGFAEERLIQPFRRRLDVPARLEVPWTEGLACAAPAPTAAGEGPTFALGDEVVSASRVASESRDGREYVVVELERALVPTCTGELVLPPATLRYSYATVFDDDLLEGPIPTDPSDASVAGEALALTILPLPEEGRPLDFTGAVGRFTLDASVASPRVVAGESFALELTIAGEGNLDGFDLPRFEELGDFRELGRIDNTADGERLVRLDLAARDTSARGLPALALSFFDPDVPGYVIARSDPIALEVRAARAMPSGASPQPEPDYGERATSALLLGAVLAAIAALVWVLSRARGRGGRAGG